MTRYGLRRREPRSRGSTGVGKPGPGRLRRRTRSKGFARRALRLRRLRRPRDRRRGPLGARRPRADGVPRDRGTAQRRRGQASDVSRGAGVRGERCKPTDAAAPANKNKSALGWLLDQEGPPWFAAADPPPPTGGPAPFLRRARHGSCGSPTPHAGPLLPASLRCPRVCAAVRLPHPAWCAFRTLPLPLPPRSGVNRTPRFIP